MFVLLFSIARSALAQTPAPSEFELGKAAMDAHDPTAAIRHFERAEGKASRSWIAVALMMESRSPGDEYVQRAFDAAAQSRANRPERLRSRSDLAAALHPGDAIVTFLIGEQHAYAWALDRDTLIGYPLPRPDGIATAVERVKGYVAQNDREGVQRIADDLVPALLGPLFERVPSLTRVTFVMDGPLRTLPILELLSTDTAPGIERLAVSIADDESLFDEIQRPPTPRESPRREWPRLALLVGAAAIAIAAISLLARRRSRARS